MKKILLQHSILSYKIDLYFPEHKLAIEVDEKGHKERKKYDEEERENAIKEHLDCKFIRINPDKENFDMDIEIGKIYNHNNKPSEKLSIDTI